MKKILLCAVMAILSLVFCCSCISKEESADTAKTSPISIENFEGEILSRLSVKMPIESKNKEDGIVYSGTGLEYSVKTSSNNYIQSISVTVTDVDTEFFDEITFYNIEKTDNSLEAQKKAGVDAIRYFAMPLTLLCNLQDEDAIDTALSARTRELTESGWTLTLTKGNNSVSLDMVYVG